MIGTIHVLKADVFVHFVHCCSHRTWTGDLYLYIDWHLFIYLLLNKYLLNK